MKERPILFSAPMVNAILAGRKTQTRRVVKNPEWFGCLTGDCPHDRQIECDAAVAALCPYGVSGDRLYVRETWARDVPGCEGGVAYRADHDNPRGDGPAHPMRWRPSIHMPRRFSRITLEITEVRVERLQDISEADAEAEGVREPSLGEWVDFGFILAPRATTPAVTCFANLWANINGVESWPANSWVWALSFRRVEQQARAA